jgi:hypothetical protein
MTIDLPAIRKAASAVLAIEANPEMESHRHALDASQFRALCNPATVLAMVKVCEAMQAIQKVGFAEDELTDLGLCYVRTKEIARKAMEGMET